MGDESGVIYRQCITLRNGKRICKPAGQAFRIPVNDDGKPPSNDQTPNKPDKKAG